MKIKLSHLIPATVLSVALISPLFDHAFAQGTAFTYQGQLQSGASVANGSYDMAFTLYTTNTTGTPIAGPVTNSAVAVTNGLFTTLVNFTTGFTGGSNWLQIAVSTNGANSFSPLLPRQQLTPAPYAVYAESANAMNLTGTVPDANLSTNVPRLNTGNTYSGLNVYNNLLKVVGPVSNNGYFGLLEEDTSDTGDFWILTKWDSVGNKRFSIYDGNGVTPIVFQEHGGNVGIGTLTPSSALQVSGTVTASEFSGPGTNLTGVALLAGGNNFTGLQTITNLGFGFMHSDGNHTVGDYIDSLGGRIGTLTDDPFGIFVNSGLPSFMVNSNGLVGIGTTTPASALQVVGTVTASGFSGSGTGLTGVALLNANNTFLAQQTFKVGPGTYGCVMTDGTNQLGSYISQGQCSFGTITPHALGFFVNNGFDSMDLNTNGFLGIGTSTPANTLDVQGSADFSGNVGIGTNSPTSTLQVNGTVAASALRAPGAGINTATYAFVQRAVGANIATDGTIISNPSCDGNPNAIILVTHNWTYDTNSTSQYNTKPVGVYYTGANWVIFNEDGTAMAPGRAFNVLVVKP